MELADNKKTFRLRAYCDDGAMGKSWDDGVDTFETYDKALIAAYRSALEVAQDMNANLGENGWWFEVEKDFEVTGTYANEVVMLGTVFPVALLAYDHAPWNRENDCGIVIQTGYLIGEEHT